MTGKEFKEYINNTLGDEDIIEYIVIGQGNYCDPELADLEFRRITSEDKTYYSLWS